MNYIFYDMTETQRREAGELENWQSWQEAGKPDRPMITEISYTQLPF